MIGKLIKTAFLSFLLSVNIATSAHAQSEFDDAQDTPNPEFKAVIKQIEAIKINNGTLFDASATFNPDPEINLAYSWDFGDGNINEGSAVLHAYKIPGKYTVILTVSDGEKKSKDEMQIFAYRKMMVLISDQKKAQERIELIKEYAEKEGVYIKLIESFGAATEFISEEILSNKLIEQADNVFAADQILIWTKENAGLNALSRFLQANKKENQDLRQNTITIIDDNFRNNTNRIQSQFNVINPQQIIAITEAGIYALIESIDVQEFKEKLKQSAYEHKIINEKSGKLRPWNFMSYFVNLLINNGVPDNTIALLLLIPVIATIIVIMKQVVGLNTSGIYTPVILTICFLIIGINTGLIILLLTLFTGISAVLLLKKSNMQFIPKASIVMIIVTIAIFILISLNVYLNVFQASPQSIATIFPMIIISTLMEKLNKAKNLKSMIPPLSTLIETIIAVITAYFIVGGEINLYFATLQIGIIKRIMLTYPELILLLIIINVLLGKWTGLMLKERIKFREIYKHIEE